MTGAEAAKMAFERFEARIIAMVQAVVEFTPIAVSSAAGDKDAVNVQDEEGNNRQRPVRRTSPWGISGRPVAGDGVLAAIVKAVAGPFGGMIVGIATDKYGPQDLKVGETYIWNKVTGTRAFFDENGKIWIDAASGQDIVLNGGALQVARKTDKTIADVTMATWIGKVTTAAATIDPTIVAPTDFGKINGGAGNVKA